MDGMSLSDHRGLSVGRSEQDRRELRPPKFYQNASDTPKTTALPIRGRSRRELTGVFLRCKEPCARFSRPMQTGPGVLVKGAADMLAPPAPMLCAQLWLRSNDCNPRRGRRDPAATGDAPSDAAGLAPSLRRSRGRRPLMVGAMPVPWYAPERRSALHGELHGKGPHRRRCGPLNSPRRLSNRAPFRSCRANYASESEPAGRAVAGEAEAREAEIPSSPRSKLRGPWGCSE